MRPKSEPSQRSHWIKKSRSRLNRRGVKKVRWDHIQSPPTPNHRRRTPSPVSVEREKRSGRGEKERDQPMSSAACISLGPTPLSHLKNAEKGAAFSLASVRGAGFRPSPSALFLRIPSRPSRRKPSPRRTAVRPFSPVMEWQDCRYSNEPSLARLLVSSSCLMLESADYVAIVRTRSETGLTNFNVNL